MQTRKLYNGIEIPVIGFGTFKIDEGPVEELVKLALKSGYTLIDAASAYQNEVGVGKALATRDASTLFVTTKIANEDQGYDETIAAVKKSLQDLQLETLDLVLIHWPNPKSAETWRALEDLYEEGKIRAIGVSNFHQHHLEKLFTGARIKPMLNQLERHPYLIQRDLELFCRQHGILVQAWSPLAKGQVFNEAILHTIAHHHDVSVAQVVLKWQLQTGWLAVVKSSSEKRMLNNIDVDGFLLNDEEIELIESLNRDYRTGSNPDNFEF